MKELSSNYKDAIESQDKRYREHAKILEDRVVSAETKLEEKLYDMKLTEKQLLMKNHESEI